MGGPVWAVVVAAGRGVRFGSEKQFATLAGQKVMDRAVAAVATAADGVVLVVPPETAESVEPEAGVVVVPGGETRAASVRAGLAAVPQDCDVVVVHDAARPLASESLCRAVIDAVRAGADGAIPGVPVPDTIKRVAGGVVAETVDRSVLVRVQTPQAFAADTLRKAHEGCPEATDDAALVEAAGGRVVVVPGEEWNLKITSPGDLDLASWWQARAEVSGSGNDGR